jgi:hypothetical protein
MHIREKVVDGCSCKEIAGLLSNRPCQQTVQTVPNGYTLGLFSRQGSKDCTHTVRKLDSIAREHLPA